MRDSYCIILTQFYFGDRPTPNPGDSCGFSNVDRVTIVVVVVVVVVVVLLFR